MFHVKGSDIVHTTGDDLSTIKGTHKLYQFVSGYRNTDGSEPSHANQLAAIRAAGCAGSIALKLHVRSSSCKCEPCRRHAWSECASVVKGLTKTFGSMVVPSFIEKVTAKPRTAEI